MNRDTINVSLSDMHSGGLTALFPNYPMTFRLDEKNSLNYAPSFDQIKMYEHFIKCADEVKRRAIGKRMVIVHNGDAIEGFHHGNVQVVTPNPQHHTAIFIELFDVFLDRVGFSVKNGDELHFTSGTESHTDWQEYGISKHFEVFEAQYHDELCKEINGKLVWWTHHGPNPGKGANEGNAHRNWLRDIYWDSVKEKRQPPHLVITSHFHKSHYDSYNQSYEHTVHGIVLPSWQMKTRYAHRVAPFQRNDIGLTVTEITSDGHIRIEDSALTMEM